MKKKLSKKYCILIGIVVFVLLLLVLFFIYVGDYYHANLEDVSVLEQGVDFYCGGKGVATSSQDYGFYYTEDDLPKAIWCGVKYCDDSLLVEDGNGYSTTDTTILGWFLDFTAPCFLNFNKDNAKYIIFDKVVVREESNT